MKKSRKNFIFALFLILTAMSGAAVGVLFNTYVALALVIGLVVLFTRMIASFHSERPYWGVDFIVTFCIGFSFGSQQMVSLTNILICVVTLVIVLAVAFYVYSGCEKK